MTALTTSLPYRPISKPMTVAARVAAACATDIENSSPTSAPTRPKMRPVSQAAIALPTISAAANPSARRIVDHSNMTSGSNSSPTEIRNVGMKKALPMKSVTAISGLALGTRRFSPTPTKKAPRSGSIPTRSATTADDVRPTNRSMYRRVRSWPSPVKNHRAIAGTTTKQYTPSTTNPMVMSNTRRGPLVSPVSAPTMSASTTSETPSVIALGPHDRRDGPGLRQPVLRHCRVRDQGERRPERSDQQRRSQVDAEQQCRAGAERHRDEGREQAEARPI